MFQLLIVAFAYSRVPTLVLKDWKKFFGHFPGWKSLEKNFLACWYGKWKHFWRLDPTFRELLFVCFPLYYL